MQDVFEQIAKGLKYSFGSNVVFNPATKALNVSFMLAFDCSLVFIYEKYSNDQPAQNDPMSMTYTNDDGTEVNIPSLISYTKAGTTTRFRRDTFFCGEMPRGRHMKIMYAGNNVLNAYNIYFINYNMGIQEDVT